MTRVLKVFLGVSLVLHLAVADYGTLQRVNIKTDVCEDCGMSGAGQVQLKICGGSPEHCCGIVNIANFDSGLFEEGQTDSYASTQLEDCQNYRLDRANSPQDVQLTVYHEGAFDGVQLEHVELVTDFVTLRCPQGVFMSDYAAYTSECYLI